MKEAMVNSAGSKNEIIVKFGQLPTLPLLRICPHYMIETTFSIQIFLVTANGIAVTFSFPTLALENK